MIKSYFIFLCLLIFHSGFCQIKKPQKALIIGDSLQELPLKFIYDNPYHIEDTRLSKLKGKIVILDFFSIGCGSCIHSLPRLDSLQQKYDHQIQIIVVASESAKAIKQFLITNKNVKGIRLPFITGDTVLVKIFPHRFIPHEVWLKDQKVIAISEANEVNENNIQKAIVGLKSFLLPIKKDKMDFDNSNSLQNQLMVDDSALMIQQCLITNYYPGVGTRKSITIQGNRKRQTILNWPILGLFQLAWGFASNRILLEVKDPSLFFYNLESDHEKWNRNNLYCYEITLPISIPDSTVKNSLRFTLNSFTPYWGRFETKKINCYALQLNGNRRLYLLDENFSNGISYLADDSLVFKNMTIESFVAHYNTSSTPSPDKPIVINETGDNMLLNVKISKNAMNHIENLRKEMAAFGIDVVAVQRDLDVFIVRDK